MMGSVLVLFSMLTLPQLFLDQVQNLQLKPTDRVLVVSISDQKLTLFEKGEQKGEYAISTAKNGTGQKANSFQTPLGLHRIKQKIGNGAPLYAIFESREHKGELWKPDSEVPQETAPKDASSETNAVTNVQSSLNRNADLITSRVLWLEGLEPGVNEGTNSEGVVVDSYQRFIYIHGTNHEVDIGKPSSHGCIRMMNVDVMKVFDSVQEGDLVWIQE